MSALARQLFLLVDRTNARYWYSVASVCRHLSSVRNVSWL